MRVKILILGIIYTLFLSTAKPQSVVGSSVSMFDLMEFKVVKDYKMFISKQDGMFTCWANVIETIYKAQGEFVDEKNVIINGTMYAKNFQIFDNMYSQYIDTYYATIPRAPYLQMLNGRVTPILPNEIEQNIDRDYVIVYLSNGHTSFIVGYSKEYYLAVNSYYGKIEKIPKHALLTHSPEVDPEPPMFLTVNGQVSKNLQIAKHP